MKIRPLLIDDEARRKAQGLICAARENPHTFERLQRVGTGEEQPVGDHYRIVLPVGYRVVYSLEQHPRKDETGFTWLHHLSIAVSRAGNAWPNQAAVEEIVSLFGMPPLTHCYVYQEGSDDDKIPSAINVLAECHDPPA
jgi:hypothetical protein